MLSVDRQKFAAWLQQIPAEEELDCTGTYCPLLRFLGLEGTGAYLFVDHFFPSLEAWKKDQRERIEPWMSEFQRQLEDATIKQGIVATALDARRALERTP